jgi:hypothetical protein
MTEPNAQQQTIEQFFAELADAEEFEFEEIDESDQ